MFLNFILYLALIGKNKMDKKKKCNFKLYAQINTLKNGTKYIFHWNKKKTTDKTNI